MNASDFQAGWAQACADTFALFAQTVTWKGKAIPAVVDGLPHETGPHHGGGGFIEDFRGSITFQKSDLAGLPCPKVGDLIVIAGRKLRFVDVSNADDAADPTIHCSYESHAA